MPENDRPAPILIFQVGKVGSMTVQSALEDMDLGVPIYHAHLLPRMEEFARNNCGWIRDWESSDTYKSLSVWQNIRDEFLLWKGSKWRIVSMVRDPVARNLSAFFQTIADREPEIYRKLQSGEVDIPNLTQVFLQDRGINQAPLVWFDRELDRFFHIDVFATPFDRARGFQLYEARWAKAAVVRLEDFDHALKPAMEALLGVEGFEVRKSVNVGAEKEYAEAYRLFRRQVVLPDTYLETQYSSKFAEHFYSDAEIEALWQQWRRPGA